MKKILTIIFFITILVDAYAQNISKEESLKDFSTLIAKDGMNIIIKESDKNHIQILSNSDGHKDIFYKIKQGILYIMESGRAQYNFTPSPLTVYKHTPDTKIIIYSKNLSKIYLNDFTKAKLIDFGVQTLTIELKKNSSLEGELNVKNLSLEIKENSGADISGKVDYIKSKVDSKSDLRIISNEFDLVDLDLNNGSRAYLRGNARKLQATINNNSRISGIDFKLKEARININNNSDCFVHVSDKLQMEVNNNSKIQATGHPKYQALGDGTGKIKVK